MQRSKKEGLILALVALIGVSGLFLLQMLRQPGKNAGENRSLVQTDTEANNAQNAAQAQSKIQKIPPDLLKMDSQPECDRPIRFSLGDFQPGATYTLDPGDGSGIKAFENGQLRHTYHKSGAFKITLSASYQGETEQLQLVTTVAAKPLEQKTVNKKTGKPVIDF